MKVNIKNYFITTCLLAICSSIPTTAFAASDTVKPSISGATNTTVYLGASFNTLAGVTAKDNIDGNITKKIKVSGSVNVKKTGTYKLTYTVSDKAKNKRVVTRAVKVKKDTVNPSISGATNKTIYIGSSFNNLTGIVAKDNADGVITKNIKVSGKVNTKKTGTYKLIYTVLDKAKNKTTVTRTIIVKKDTTKPVISGASNKKIYVNSSFNALTGIIAKDNVDGNITQNIKVSGKVNTKKTGIYKLTYTVSDKAKNKTVVTRTITIIDNIKPIISGAKDVQINFGDKFNALTGVSASDNNDGNITSSIRITGSVNVNKAGTYVLTYKVSDKSGNVTSIKRKVTVIDKILPVFSGIKDIQINFGQEFNPLTGISASDNSDGDITSTIQVSGSVDVNKAGTYSLTYSVTDQSGNIVSTTRTVIVIDNIKPVISGATDVVAGLNTTFNPLEGVSVSDNNDGDLTEEIKTTGSVDTSVEGDYFVTYSVSDKSGNSMEIKRKVTVKKISVSAIEIANLNTMKTDKTQQLTATIYPSDATYQKVTWTSSNELIAKVDEDGLLTTLSEGTVTITAIADGITTSKTLIVSDQPNVSMNAYGSVIINNLIQGLSINLYNYEPKEQVFIEKIEIYENGSLFTSYSPEALQNSGIDTVINPYSNWGISINFRFGLWQNQSKVVVTVRTENDKLYKYTKDL
ncbi:immunoglobulin-like domain-containing protein [Exiguobacterium acetylicum]|uniref:immunoglobulin-like domain-containing protein n=1 Tax=Exiguobacterium acetylicum TaxID=41170 RepID=UPI001EE2F301|nr:immunoglobulin-like domain-containing protein [Exiguobacterium acetylicum]UKS55696.1 DUF5011 domain-containing protein [Exiguobacterium acetylicum]